MRRNSGSGYLASRIAVEEATMAAVAAAVVGVSVACRNSANKPLAASNHSRGLNPKPGFQPLNRFTSCPPELGVIPCKVTPITNPKIRVYFPIHSSSA